MDDQITHTPNRVNYPAASGGALSPSLRRSELKQPSLSYVIRLLVLYVPPDQFGSHMFTCRSHIVSISPQLTTPVCLIQLRKLSIQLTCSVTLYHIHNSRRGITRRTTDKQMHMVLLYSQCLHLPIPRSTNFSYQLLQPLGYVSCQYLTTIAWNPDVVICQPVDRMSTSPRFHNCLYSITRSHSLQYGSLFVGCPNQQGALPAFGRPAFLPAASGGVSSRSLS